MKEHRFNTHHAPRRRPVWVPAALCLASLSACGGDDPAPAGASLNGCADGAFVDRSAAGASRTVSFGTGASAFAYDPRCITVAAGQSVTFSGDFSVHPLVPGPAPTMTGGATSGNPVPRMSTGREVTVTFPVAGTFPYYCQSHHANGTGMAGVVRVR